MTNRLKRGILAGSLAAALAVGCSSDSSKAVNGPSEYEPVQTIESASNSIRSHARGNTELERRVDESLVKIRNRNAGKIAQVAEPIVVDYDAKIGDFNNDHYVDLNDFFNFADAFGTEDESYDLTGDSFVGLDDFFIFADQYGNVYNRKPRAIGLEFENEELSVGQLFTITGMGEDVEQDDLEYVLSLEGKDVEVNGGHFQSIHDEEGDYTYGLRIEDNFGGISNTYTTTVQVRNNGPVLSLPDTLLVNQYINGQRNGGIGKINLRDFTESDIVEWDARVLNNEFTHDRSNAPLAEVLWYPYTVEALKTEIRGDTLFVNPFRNYNSEDHEGSRKVEVKGIDSEGRIVRDTLDVYVKRNAGFDDLYDSVITGIRWDPLPKTYAIWTGNHAKEGDNFGNYTGPLTTQGEIDDFRRLHELGVEMLDELRDVEVVEIGDASEVSELYNRNFAEDGSIISGNGSILMQMRDYGSSSSTAQTYDPSTGIFNFGEVSHKSNNGFKVAMHEYLHALTGSKHGPNFVNLGRTNTAFSGDYNGPTDRYPARDEAIIVSYFE